MVDTAAAYAPGESEPDILGLSLTPSKKVKPPRLTDSPVAIECERIMSLSLSRKIYFARSGCGYFRERRIDRHTSK